MNENYWRDFLTYLLVDRKLAGGLKNEQYLKSRFKMLCEFFRDKEFSRSTFNEFIYQKKARGLSHAYINNLIKLAKHWDTFQKTNILSDYTYFKRQTKVYDILTPEEIKSLALLDYPYFRNREALFKKYRCLIFFLGMTGCRIDEALSLLWRDVHNSPQSVIFRNTKNGEDRLIPIGKFLYELLFTLPRSELVFSHNSKKLDVSDINTDLKKRSSALGLQKRVYCHIFRHSYATTMLEAGVDISDVSRLLGHSNLSSTMTYKHNMLNHYVEVMYAHPLLAQELTIEMIGEQVTSYVEKLLKRISMNKEMITLPNKKKYILGNGRLIIQINNKEIKKHS